MNTVKLLKIHTIQIENSIIITIEYNTFRLKYKLSQHAYSIVIISSQLYKELQFKRFRSRRNYAIINSFYNAIFISNSINGRS